MYLPDELLAALRLRARQEDRPVAEIVREAFVEYVAKRPRMLPVSIGIAAGPDDELSGHELKAKMREEWGRDLDRRATRPPRRASTPEPR